MAPNKTHFRKCKHEEHEDPSHPYWCKTFCLQIRIQSPLQEPCLCDAGSPPALGWTVPSVTGDATGDTPGPAKFRRSHPRLHQVTTLNESQLDSAWCTRLQVLFFQHFTTAILQANLRQASTFWCYVCFLIWSQGDMVYKAWIPSKRFKKDACREGFQK